MSLLPSPIPHPLEFSPFDVPGWAYEALEWVVGFDWPAGNEVSTWDVADRWYVLATDLASPREATFDAAARVLDGYGGAGITADGFRNAFQQLAGDDDAPLNGLLHIADGLGQLVEGCGRDLEGAKLEAWIEIGIFLTELIGMAITVALTFGAASPAAGGLIMTTRMAIQQIFKRLVEQLGKKALKATAQHAIKELTTKQGLTKIGRKALHEGLEEAREEFATNGGIQLYQESTGRSHGLSFTDLGLSAVGGFAGGAAAVGSEVGAHGHHGGVVRGAGGEVFAEFGAAAAFGDLPGLENAAKAGASGASGSAIHGVASTVDASASSLGKLDLEGSSPSFGDIGSSADGFAGTSSTESSFAADSTDGVGANGSASGNGSHGAASGDARLNGATSGDAGLNGATSGDAGLNGAASGDAGLNGATSGDAGLNGTTSGDAGLNGTTSGDAGLNGTTSGDSHLNGADSNGGASSGAPAIAASADGSATTPSPAGLSSTDGPSALAGHSTDASLGLGSSTSAGTSATVSVTGPADVSSPDSSPRLSDISLSSPATSTAPLNTALAGPPSLSTDPTAQFFANPTPAVVTPGASTVRRPLSDLDRIAAALGPTETRTASSRTIPRQPSSRVPTNPYADPIRNDAGYFGYAQHVRRTHELNRRDEYINYLTSIAEQGRAKILGLGHDADLAFRAGLTLRGADHRRRATEFSAIVDEIETQIDHVRTGRLAPAKVEVGPRDWARINTDVGNLAPGGVHTDDLSAVTGSFGRPPIDSTRRYNVVGGLRAPLAVHQTDLENAVPRAGDGRPQRLPDPRTGRWFRLANDGGPELDPTRGLNCVDGVLALFDTYIHGRPRVSAPRTFDTYAHGNPDRPLGGETNGIRRIQDATGTTFQNLCPYMGSASPAAAKPAIDLALRNLRNHLLNTGHGAYAFIVTDIEAGGSHAWAATNHHGTILFLDPQIGRIAENTSPYAHRGTRANTNITSLDALVVDANGTPAPLPHHGPGQRSAAPTGAADENRPPTSPSDGLDLESVVERQALESLSSDERDVIEDVQRRSTKIANRILPDLQRIAATAAPAPDGTQPKVTGENHRTKEPDSIARAFLDDVAARQAGLGKFLADAKDLVRFSIEVSEVGYGRSVVQILKTLTASGYKVHRLLSFWAPRGRHNGLNVTMTDAEGKVFELQFPTPLTSSIGADTHALYKRVRTGRFSSKERIDALLKIFALNKERHLSEHQPSDLQVLLEMNARIDTADTTFSRWTEKKRRVWTRYEAALAADGISLDDVLARHGLTRDDVFGPSEGQET
ncbi:hypothetical protein HH310_25010 [Actinoplanes sp. TBRC 11911]|uniref:toxin glutamine deamidase domain-containing protein n=1 Tax=Actinoplanes sp. TBRC 11911 TaxID=2729386 RepID=UPI00145C5338|nr:toxin glutamine deamidase domain-containing protein [Actinoplanes sp. TBRC 11911]NMO54431.1 hypothetical protein [Actinoplanes sp. TBRC 11911]